MSEANFYVKQVWRQKGDAPFDRIPFKEQNKAQELSQTTRPVLLVETKSNGGCNAVFAIGHVAEATVIEEAVSYPNTTGEYLYHVPFAYDFVLEDKKNGISREELQELAAQKFSPQLKGGLYEIEESVLAQVETLLKERAAAAPAPAVEKKAEAKKPAAKKAEAPKAAVSVKAPAPAVDGGVLADALKNVQEQLVANPGLRLLAEEGAFNVYPAALLHGAQDLVELQQTLSEYAAGGANKAALDQTAQEVATAGLASSPRYANVIGLVERLVREGRYESVQVPTLQKAFYREGNLPHPYDVIELQGKQGHHVLGTNGTLYTAEGKVVQHYLGL
jgi:hypothetical protein